jgi:hypothetical protein
LNQINGDQDSDLEATQCALLADNTYTSVSTPAANATAAMFESNVAVGKNMEGGSKSEIQWKVTCGSFMLNNALSDS